MPSFCINADLFAKRLNVLYTQWKALSKSSGTAWHDLDGFFIDVGDTSVHDSICSPKTALQVWLLQSEIPDTIMAFLESSVFLLVSKNYSEIIDKLSTDYKMHQNQEGSLNSKKPELIVLYQDETDDNQKNFEKILCFETMTSEDHKRLNLGFVSPSKKDKHATEFIQSWKRALEAAQTRYVPVDMFDSIVRLMAVKDETELELLKQSNKISNKIFKNFLREEVMAIVDGDLKVTHSSLAEKLEECYRDPNYFSKADMKHIDPCYPPIFQSGGKYSMKITQISTDDLIRFDVITCSFGTVYKNYCSNITRTFLINPTPEMMNNYRFLQSIEAEIIKLLVPGVQFCDVYESTLNFIKMRNPSLSENLHPILGFCVGILFSKQPLVMTPKSTVVVEKGMVIHVCPMLDKLINWAVPEDQPQRNYVLMLGDTVVVNEAGPATMVAELPQKLSWLSLVIEQDSSKLESKALLVETESELLGRGVRKVVLEARFRYDDGANLKRQRLRRDMLATLNINAEKRLLTHPPSNHEVSLMKAINKEIVSYKKPSKFPKVPEIDDLKIYVDQACETLILPVFGIQIPFHVATLKNVSTSREGDFMYLRINFMNPSTTLILERKTTPVVFQNPHFHFVKEMTFKASTLKPSEIYIAPGEDLIRTAILIKEMRKRYRLRIAAAHEAMNVCKQKELICFDQKRTKIPTLNSIIARPTVNSGDKIRRWNSTAQTGVLEAHQNGVRFRVKTETIDVLYDNIKCAIFQPCDLEIGAFLHFALQKEILVAKKKYAHVQFYTELGEISTDLVKRRNRVDRYEDELERAEEEQKQVLNNRFRDFCDIIQRISDVEFEEPIRDLGFFGAPGQCRASVLLQPSTSALVNVTEWPPFVIMLDDIELIHFERVEFVLRTFDMVVIFKDYSRKVVVINAVPIDRIEKIKTWMEVCQIPFTEGPASLNWSKIMKTIAADPAEFFATGGWTFLEDGDDDESPERPEKDGNPDDETRITDDEYEPPSQESSSDEDDEHEEATDYSGESSEEAEGSCSESDSLSDKEGKSWEELEREARAADNKASQMQMEATSDHGKKRKHHKGRSSEEPKKLKFTHPIEISIQQRNDRPSRNSVPSWWKGTS